jgi:hypothetical protein
LKKNRCRLYSTNSLKKKSKEKMKLPKMIELIDTREILKNKLLRMNKNVRK